MSDTWDVLEARLEVPLPTSASRPGQVLATGSPQYYRMS